MKLSEIEELWENDNKIDDVMLDTSSIDISKLHNKYYIILNQEKTIYSKFLLEKRTLHVDKFEYYGGNISEEKLKERNWLPFGEKILKSNISMYIEADADMLKLDRYIEIQSIKIEYLESIIKQINSRSFNIKNIIEWRKFTNGIV